MTAQHSADSPTVTHACAPVPGPHMVGFSTCLRESGYAPRSILEFMQAAVHCAITASLRRPAEHRTP